MSDSHHSSVMDNLYWWGIPTLFRCPNLPPGGQDIALVGVPHSAGNGTTERDQHLGPREHYETFQRCNEECIQQITDFYKTIDAAGARPVSVGGDHSITSGIVQAIVVT